MTLTLRQRVGKIVQNYNPSQPRANNGRWSAGGVGAAMASSGIAISTQGNFRANTKDLLTPDKFVKQMEKAGFQHVESTPSFSGPVRMTTSIFTKGDHAIKAVMRETGTSFAELTHQKTKAVKEKQNKAETTPAKSKKSKSPTDKVAKGAEVFGGKGTKYPTEEEMKSLEGKILKNPKSEYIMAIQNHPDVGLINAKGSRVALKKTSDKTMKPMEDGACHWNTAKLFEAGEVDSIVVGYAKHPENGGGWHQHTWGLKNGKIVETTASNKAVKEYYGAVLDNKQAKAFVAHAKVATPGKMMMRYVHPNLVTNANAQEQEESGPVTEEMRKERPFLSLNQRNRADLCSEELSVNFKGKIRRVSYKGRDYLVAPMRMIVPGVLNGNKGPILYVPEENAKSKALWNYMPIVVNHPFRPDGKAGSAKDKGVIRRTGIGFVANTRDGKFLDAEGWFDIEKTKKVDYRIFANLVAKRPIELSTGLYMDYEPATPGAVHNGVPYRYIARNYRPDHLAVLPDEEGACSLKDGCGVLVNSKPSLLQRVKNIIFNYNPSQPRDSEGQWSSGGGSGGSSKTNKLPGGAATAGKLAEKASERASATKPGTPEFQKAHKEAAEMHSVAAKEFAKKGDQINEIDHEMKAEHHSLHAEQPVTKPTKVKEQKLVDREYSKLADEVPEDAEVASLMKPGFSTQKDAMTPEQRRSHKQEMNDYISKRNAGRLPEQLAAKVPHLGNQHLAKLKEPPVDKVVIDQAARSLGGTFVISKTSASSGRLVGGDPQQNKVRVATEHVIEHRDPRSIVGQFRGKIAQAAKGKNLSIVSSSRKASGGFKITATDAFGDYETFEIVPRGTVTNNSKSPLLSRVAAIVMNYNPSQPRDGQGRWSSGGGSGSSSSSGKSGGAKSKRRGGKSLEEENDEIMRRYENGDPDLMEQVAAEEAADNDKTLHGGDYSGVTGKILKDAEDASPEEKKRAQEAYDKGDSLTLDKNANQGEVSVTDGMSAAEKANYTAQAAGFRDRQHQLQSLTGDALDKALKEDNAAFHAEMASKNLKMAAEAESVGDTVEAEFRKWKADIHTKSASNPRGVDKEPTTLAEQRDREARNAGFFDAAHQESVKQRNAAKTAEKAGVDPDAAVSTKKILDGGFGVDTSKTPSFEELQKRQSDMFAREDAAKKAKHEASYQETQQQLSETIKRVEAREAAADSKANVRAEAMSELIKEKGSVQAVTAKDLKERIQQKAFRPATLVRGPVKGSNISVKDLETQTGGKLIKSQARGVQGGYINPTNSVSNLHIIEHTNAGKAAQEYLKTMEGSGLSVSQVSRSRFGFKISIRDPKTDITDHVEFRQRKGPTTNKALVSRVASIVGNYK